MDTVSNKGGITMYIFTNYDKNVLSDTFLSWYDNGKSNDYILKDFYTIGDLMLHYFENEANTTYVIKLENRYFEFPKSSFGFRDSEIREVLKTDKMKIITYWKEKE